VRDGGEMIQTLYAHMNKIKIKKKKCFQAMRQWLTPGILATQKTEIRRVVV
jgi:hypothetical protein